MTEQEALRMMIDEVTRFYQVNQCYFTSMNSEITSVKNSEYSKDGLLTRAIFKGKDKDNCYSFYNSLTNIHIGRTINCCRILCAKEDTKICIGANFRVRKKIRETEVVAEISRSVDCVGLKSLNVDVILYV